MLYCAIVTAVSPPSLSSSFQHGRHFVPKASWPTSWLSIIQASPNNEPLDLSLSRPSIAYAFLSFFSPDPTPRNLHYMLRSIDIEEHSSK